ncbi:hypothetical protein DOU59_10820 [Shigella boydii]|nr:hypothetical protein [Shigella boydii]
MTDFGGKTSIFSHPVYLFLRKFSLQDSRGGSFCDINANRCIFHLWSFQSEGALCIPYWAL